MSASAEQSIDALVIGAGFGGLYSLYRLREAEGLSVRALEAGSDVGGTWYWNRYPGLKCDAQSISYSYSFSEELQQEWTWSERYASQPEILSYLQHVADRFDLRRDISFDTRAVSARFDEGASRWRVETDGGQVWNARFLILATGNLSTFRVPPFEGIDSYRGETYFTGRWPHEPVTLAGKRVGVIGTGSSGVQVIPKIAEEASELVVFQRTPHFCIPARNHKLDPDYVRDVKARYPEIREQARHSARGGSPVAANPKSALEVSEKERNAVFEQRWAEGGGGNFLSAFTDLLTDLDANRTVADFVRSKIRDTVRDPEVAEQLSPRDYPLGAKRIILDTDYYETYNRDNVRLVDLRSAPIQRLTPDGIKVGDEEIQLDAIVFATGFDAFTGSLLAINPEGRAGKSLADAWSEGPVTYLGLQTSSFPNLFYITGPGSPSVLSNVVMSIEQHVDWIADLIRHMSREGHTTVEPDESAQSAWCDHVADLAARTLYVRADSWYLGANVPGKKRMFMAYVGGVGKYREICDQVAERGYAGFVLDGDVTTENDVPEDIWGKATALETSEGPPTDAV